MADLEPESEELPNRENLLEVYDLEGRVITTWEREKYYSSIRREFAKDKKITRMVKSIRLLLMNPSGGIFIQKRSDEKEENPGLYDKTIGSHVLAGSTYERTITKQCAKELGFAASIVSEEEFNNASNDTNLGVIGIFKQVDFKPIFKSIRINQDGSKFEQPFISSFYIGHYGGDIRFKEGESNGIEVVPLEELKKEITDNPNMFTEDLKFMINEYTHHLKPIKSSKDKEELIEIYDLEGKLLRTSKRDKFYKSIKKEYNKNEKVTNMVKSIRLILMNSNGKIYIQKRSIWKNENPGLYDKTIGGHVTAGSSYDRTVVKECAEELGFAASIVPMEEFDNASKDIDLKIVGVFKKVDFKAPFYSTRFNKDGSKFIQPFMSPFYVGYYDGSTRFTDGESSGIEVVSLDKLKKDILDNPMKYTEDLKFMINTYEHHLKPLK